MSDEGEFFTIIGPGRVKLGPEAVALAKQWGMTPTQMAKHLLNEDRKRERGDNQKIGHD
jgi:hypothetical protein